MFRKKTLLSLSKLSLLSSDKSNEEQEPELESTVHTSHFGILLDVMYFITRTQQ